MNLRNPATSWSRTLGFPREPYIAHKSSYISLTLLCACLLGSKTAAHFYWSSVRTLFTLISFPSPLRTISIYLEKDFWRLDSLWNKKLGRSFYVIWHIKQCCWFPVKIKNALALNSLIVILISNILNCSRIIALFPF